MYGNFESFDFVNSRDGWWANWRIFWRHHCDLSSLLVRRRRTGVIFSGRIGKRESGLLGKYISLCNPCKEES